MRQKKKNNKKRRKKGGGERGGGREEGKERKKRDARKKYALGKIRPWKRKSKNPVPNIPGDEWENRSTRRKKPLVGCS